MGEVLRLRENCVLCGNRKDQALILVNIAEVGSGPGQGLYACPEPCAQRYASWPGSPSWLRDDLQALGLWPLKS